MDQMVWCCEIIAPRALRFCALVSKPAVVTSEVPVTCPHSYLMPQNALTELVWFLRWAIFQFPPVICIGRFPGLPISRAGLSGCLSKLGSDAADGRPWVRGPASAGPFAPKSARRPAFSFPSIPLRPVHHRMRTLTPLSFSSSTSS